MKLFGTLGLAAPLVAALALVFAGRAHLDQPRVWDAHITPAAAVAWTHVVVLSVLLLLRRTSLRFDHPELQPRRPETRVAFAQYGAALDGLLLAWLGTYLCLALMWWMYGTAGNPLLWALADVFNLANASAFLGLYLILDQPSVPDAESPERDRPFRRAWIATCAVSCAAALASGAARLQLGPVTGEWAKLALLVGSLFSAVAMANFFGRFDHRYMRVSRAWLIPHGLYLGLQVFWPQLEFDEGWLTPLALGAALVLKVVMLVAQYRWMRLGVVQRYLDLAAM